MILLIFVLQKLTSLAIVIVQIALIIRIILSSLPPYSGGLLDSFCYAFTEFILLPVRRFIGKYKIFGNASIDFSYILVSVLLALANVVISIL